MALFYMVLLARSDGLWFNEIGYLDNAHLNLDINPAFCNIGFPSIIFAVYDDHMKETLCWIVWKSQYVIMFAIWLSQITLPRFQNALTDVCWESDKVWEVDKVDCTNIRQCWQRKKSSNNVDKVKKSSDNVDKGKNHLTMSGVVHRSLKNNVSINFNINVDEKSSFQK